MVTGYAGDQAHEVGFLSFQLLTGLATVVAAGFVLRSRSPYPLLVALLASASFAAVLGILTAGGGEYPQLENLLTPLEVGTRVTGPFGNPNAYSQMLAYASVLAVGWIASTRSLRVRAALLVAVGIMGFAMTLSLSRGAIATLLFGLVAFGFARGRTFGLGALGVALALVILGYPLFVEVRIATDAGSVSAAAAAELESSDDARLGAIMAGPAVFATSPVFGVGFGQYKYVSPLVTDEGAGLVAHNWYGTILAEQGLLGLSLWLMTLVTVRSWLVSRPARPRSIGLAMLAATVVGCLFLALPTVVPDVGLAQPRDNRGARRRLGRAFRGHCAQMGQPRQSRGWRDPPTRRPGSGSRGGSPHDRDTSGWLSVGRRYLMPHGRGKIRRDRRPATATR